MCYQLSSLVLHKPQEVAICMTVFCSVEDAKTAEVLNFFQSQFAAQPSIRMNVQHLALPLLFNRSIGRNKAALATTADLVWFCDCDYYFGDGCLDALATIPLDPADRHYSKLYFPATTLMTATREKGDEYSLKAKVPGVYDINPADFIIHPLRKAIGGVQIVPGPVARENGYCKDEAFQQPIPTGWADTKGDICVRRELGTPGKPWRIPACYRIRQSTQGQVDIL